MSSASRGFAPISPSGSCPWTQLGTSVLQTPSLPTPRKKSCGRLRTSVVAVSRNLTVGDTGTPREGATRSRTHPQTVSTAYGHGVPCTRKGLHQQSPVVVLSGLLSRASSCTSSEDFHKSNRPYRPTMSALIWTHLPNSFPRPRGGFSLPRSSQYEFAHVNWSSSLSPLANVDELLYADSFLAHGSMSTCGKQRSYLVEINNTNGSSNTNHNDNNMICIWPTYYRQRGQHERGFTAWLACNGTNRTSVCASCLFTAQANCFLTDISNQKLLDPSQGVPHQKFLCGQSGIQRRPLPNKRIHIYRDH